MFVAGRSLQGCSFSSPYSECLLTSSLSLHTVGTDDYSDSRKRWLSLMSRSRTCGDLHCSTFLQSLFFNICLHFSIPVNVYNVRFLKASLYNLRIKWSLIKHSLNMKSVFIYKAFKVRISFFVVYEPYFPQLVGTSRNGL
jgi:hypothetical protein